MTRFYGHYHSLAAFIGKCIPKNGSGPYHNLFVHDVVKGLKRLDAVQRKRNSGVVLPFDVDGINVFYNGSRICRVMPAQKNLLVMFADKPRLTVFDASVKSGLFKDSSQSSYRSWVVPLEGLETLWSVIETLPLLADDNTTKARKYRRHFSVAALLAAHAAFELNGNMCPGFGKQEKHKVDLTTDRIEYDHHLAFAKGGSSSERNVRIMCESCNRLKGAQIG